MVILATIVMWADAFFSTWDFLVDPVVAAVLIVLVTAVLLRVLWPRRER